MGQEVYVLTEERRMALMRVFPPKHQMFIGYHFIHRHGVERNHDMQYGGQPTCWFEVIGHADDGGLELIVIAEVKNFRPDGRRYNLPWSLNPERGRKPVQSNEMVARGFTPMNPRLRVEAILVYIESTPHPTKENTCQS